MEPVVLITEIRMREAGFAYLHLWACHLAFTFRHSLKMVSIIGLEPIVLQILSLLRIPIPPYAHKLIGGQDGNQTHTLGIMSPLLYH